VIEAQMETDLINHDYIQELLLVAQDQKEDDLVTHLFSRLQEARENFLLHSVDWREPTFDRKQLKFDLHKLKNQFANLGGVAASQLLEEMYQIADNPQKDEEFSSLLKRFQFISELTLSQLRSELRH
jgi:hypothetical protein